jgi:hypothetical protein
LIVSDPLPSVGAGKPGAVTPITVVPVFNGWNIGEAVPFAVGPGDIIIVSGMAPIDEALSLRETVSAEVPASGIV